MFPKLPYALGGVGVGMLYMAFNAAGYVRGLGWWYATGAACFSLICLPVLIDIIATLRKKYGSPIGPRPASSK